MRVPGRRGRGRHLPSQLAGDEHVKGTDGGGTEHRGRWGHYLKEGGALYVLGWWRGGRD